MAGTVIVREFKDAARDVVGERGTGLSLGELVTDESGTSIITAASVLGTAVMIGPLSSKTHFVQIETTAKLRYAIVPKAFLAAPTWSSTAVYTVGQRVRYSGAFYTALGTTTAAATPSATPGEWSKFAATANHIPLAATAVVMEPVSPGAYISVLETA